jgi:hypothetical protein
LYSSKGQKVTLQGIFATCQSVVQLLLAPVHNDCIGSAALAVWMLPGWLARAGKQFAAARQGHTDESTVHDCNAEAETQLCWTGIPCLSTPHFFLNQQEGQPLTTPHSFCRQPADWPAAT